MRRFRFLPLALAVCAGTSALLAADAETTLGRRGKLLLEEKFAGTSVPAGWTRNTGELSVHDGALRAREVAADKHVAAFRKALPLRDCLIQLDVKLDGPATFNLGFDPAPGELKKKGHLFSLILTPQQITITEHVDKADPKSTNKIHARTAAALPRGKWFTLVLELKGDTVVARVADLAPLRASVASFAVKKPGLVFRVGGKTDHAGAIDNVKVWELL